MRRIDSLAAGCRNSTCVAEFHQFATADTLFDNIRSWLYLPVAFFVTFWPKEPQLSVKLFNFQVRWQRSPSCRHCPWHVHLAGDHHQLIKENDNNDSFPGASCPWEPEEHGWLPVAQVGLEAWFQEWHIRCPNLNSLASFKSQNFSRRVNYSKDGQQHFLYTSYVISITPPPFHMCPFLCPHLFLRTSKPDNESDIHFVSLPLFLLFPPRTISRRVKTELSPRRNKVAGSRGHTHKMSYLQHFLNLFSSPNRNFFFYSSKVDISL